MKYIVIPPIYEVQRGYIFLSFPQQCVRACVCVCVCVCVIFAGTTAHRISKFGTNVGYDLLYCAEENQPPPSYHFLFICPFFFLANKISIKIHQ